MTDFPTSMLEFPVGACIHTGSPQVSTCNAGEIAVVNYAAAVAPAANRAIYIPFTLGTTAVAQQMFWENGAVAGTTDVGIYDVNYVRLVSLGATTNAGTIQVGNITDTALTPGVYYMAWLPSTVTTQTYWSAQVSSGHLRMLGVTQQAVGSATLGTPGVPAAVASSYLPFVGISFQAVM